MAPPPNRPHYYVCHFCSYPVLSEEALPEVIECPRCGHKNHRLKPRSIEKTLVYSLTALIFYIPANLFPFMTIELYGSRNSSTIWSGIVSLAEGGSWVIAMVVFLASMVVPFFKLVALFYLALIGPRNKHPRTHTKLYNIIEAVGRWSMLDIYLLAVLVAIMKLGPWTTVRPEIGSLMFVFVVVFTMLASASFDPQLLWNEENEKSGK